jgi:hypothetical protein
MPIQRITSRVIEDGIIAATDIADGSITTAKIADANITAAKLATGAALPPQTSNGTYYLTTDGTTSSWRAQTNLQVANTQITGNITSSQIVSVANTQITGNITGSQIAPNVSLSGTVTATAFSGNGASLTGVASGGVAPPVITTYHTPATFTKGPGTQFAVAEVFGAGGGAGGGGGSSSVGGTGGVGATTSFGSLASATGGNGGTGGNTFHAHTGEYSYHQGIVWSGSIGNIGNHGAPGSTGSAPVSPTVTPVTDTFLTASRSSGQGGGHGGGGGVGHLFGHEMESNISHLVRHGGSGGTGGTGGGVNVYIPGPVLGATQPVTIGAGGNAGNAGGGHQGRGPSHGAGAGNAGTGGAVRITEFK